MGAGLVKLCLAVLIHYFLLLYPFTRPLHGYLLIWVLNDPLGEIKEG